MYVDAYFDRDNDIVKVVERDRKGQRHFIEYPAKYIFYYEDPKGKYTSIYGTPVNRVVCKTQKDFHKELKINSNKRIYEADINQIFVCLSEQYLNTDAPKLNVAFFDIEVDFDPERGYASPDDAFMPITAISVHLQWLDTLVTLAVPPKTLSLSEAEELVEKFPNTMLFESEAEMLDTFLHLIEDADVITGWNSEPRPMTWWDEYTSTASNYTVGTPMKKDTPTGWMPSEKWKSVNAKQYTKAH